MVLLVRPRGVVVWRALRQLCRPMLVSILLQGALTFPVRHLPYSCAVWVLGAVARKTPIAVLGSIIALTLWLLTSMLRPPVTRCRSLSRKVCIVGPVFMVEVVTFVVLAWTVASILLLPKQTRRLFLTEVSCSLTRGSSVPIVVPLPGLPFVCRVHRLTVWHTVLALIQTQFTLVVKWCVSADPFVFVGLLTVIDITPHSLPPNRMTQNGSCTCRGYS